MTISTLLQPRVGKEVRGLLPAWLACLVGMAAAAGLGDRIRAVGLVGYFLGAVMLGALSMGHEYNARTLTLLLSQPASRARLFLEKLGVLTVMLLVLCAVAWLSLFDAVPWANWWALALVLPLLCGLFLAPWLTMVCRNALAGIVFAVAIPGTLWIAGDITSAITYGGDLATTAEASNFAYEVFWRGMLIVCAVAAASSWWMFKRLEAIDGRGLEVNLPAWLSWRAAPGVAAQALTRRRPIWLLIKKELRLQQLTFAVSGLYLLGCFSFFLFRRSFPQLQNVLLSAVTALHAGAIPLLAGSLPSAEERQLGTIEWQVLLPMPAWKQWAAKTGIAVGVAVTLVIGLPLAISYIVASPAVRSDLRQLYSPPIALAVLMATVTSLYVSSLCASGLKALVVSVPVVGVMALATRWVVNPVYGRFGIELVLNPARYRSLFGTREVVLWTLLTILTVAMYAGVLALLLRFAMANHRSAERGATRVWMQLGSVSVSLVVGSLIWVGMFIFYVDGVNQRNEAANRQWMAKRGSAIFAVEDGGGNAAQDSIVILFPAYQYQDGSLLSAFYLLTADADGRFSMGGLRPDIRYSALAVVRPGTSAATLARDLRSKPEWRLQLRQSAVDLTLRQGEVTTLTLKLTRVP